MENDAKIIWNEAPVFDPAHLYSCISIAKMSRNVIDVEQKEATQTNVKTFESLLEGRRDLLLNAECSGIVTESHNGADWF